ncbi:MAG: hypothetical protein ABTQ27_08270 [Amaricoccus sp.]|uniref:hypothetical protein n=1 Tax=Amaricoccus sp. TaxID=1872485 RepID=UPI00331579E4
MPDHAKRPGRAGSLVGFLVASALALVFAARLVDSALHWAERETPLAGWMTLGFVANAWDIDRAALAAALGVETRPGERLTLEQVARDTGRPLAEVKAETKAEIVRERGGRP